MTLARLLGCSTSKWCERWNLDCEEPPTPAAARSVDGDGDVWASVATGRIDCDDTNDEVYPGAPELCDNLDKDCDGEMDRSRGSRACLRRMPSSLSGPEVSWSGSRSAAAAT